MSHFNLRGADRVTGALLLFSQTDSDDMEWLMLGGLHIFSLAGSSVCLCVASELPVSAHNNKA